MFVRVARVAVLVGVVAAVGSFAGASEANAGLFGWLGDKVSDSTKWLGDKVSDSTKWNVSTAGKTVMWTADKAGDTVEYTVSSTGETIKWTADKAGDTLIWNGDNAADTVKWTATGAVNITQSTLDKVGDAVDYVAGDDSDSNIKQDASTATEDTGAPIVSINKFTIADADAGSNGVQKGIGRGGSVTFNIDYLVKYNKYQTSSCYLKQGGAKNIVIKTFFSDMMLDKTPKEYKLDGQYTVSKVYENTKFTLRCETSDKQIEKIVSVYIDKDIVVTTDDTPTDDDTTDTKKAEVSVVFTAKDGTDTQTVDKNGTAEFIVTVTNSGEVNLKNVVIASPTTTNCTRKATEVVQLEGYNGNEFDPSESVTFACKKQNVINGYEQFVSVSAVRVDNDIAIDTVRDTTNIVIGNSVDANDDIDNSKDDLVDDEKDATCAIAPTVAEAMESSSLVFTGTVKSVDKTFISNFFGYQQKVVVSIAANDAIYKGSSRSEVVLRVKDASLLQKGERYLIYAKRSLGAFGFTTNGCMRTKSYANAVADIEELENILNPKKDEAMLAFVKNTDGITDDLLPEKITVGAGEITLMAVGENIENCQLVQEKNGNDVVYQVKNSNVQDITNTKQLMMYVMDISGDGAQMTLKCTGTVNGEKAGELVSDSVHVVVSGSGTDTTDGYGKTASVVFISGVDTQSQPIIQADMTVAPGSEVNLQWVGKNVENCTMKSSKIVAANMKQSKTYSAEVTPKNVAKIGSYAAKVDFSTMFLIKCTGAANSEKAGESISDSVNVLVDKAVVADDTGNPSISIDINTRAVDNGTVTFSVVVKNTGDRSLKNIVITDVLASACERTVAETDALYEDQEFDSNPAEKFEYTCTKSNVAESFTNEISVMAAVVGASGAVTDTATAAIAIDDSPEDIEEEPQKIGRQLKRCSGSRIVKGFENGGNLMSVSCLDKKIRIALGDGSGSNRYTWKIAYVTENGSAFSKKVTLNGKLDKTGKWIIGAASTTIPYDIKSKGQQDNYVAMYTCKSVLGSWTCGGGNKWTIVPFKYVE